MDLSSLLSFEAVSGFLGEAAKADLTSYLIVAALIWRFIKKNVDEHFKQIYERVDRHFNDLTAGMNLLRQSLDKLTEAVSKDFKAHDARLSKVEERLDRIENKPA